MVPTEGNKTQRSGYATRATLAKLLKDPTIPANARVVAARTLAEMDGQIGRHQSAPSATGTAAVASLSRDQLVTELGRLRALLDLGLLP